MSAGAPRVRELGVHQEEDVLPAPRLVRIAAASLAVGATGVVVAWLLLRATGAPIGPDAVARAQARRAAPVEGTVEQTPIWQVQGGVDRRAAQRQELGRWGWADRARGVARIPIDRAIDLVVQEEAAR
jgi:hypothetical protein